MSMLSGNSLIYTIYIAALVVVVVLYIWNRGRRERRYKVQLEENRQAGLTEPPSLHPLIDPTLCLGSGTCVTACPEGNVIGLIRGKAQLVNPTHCIGHGACRSACPHEAITLVFGTEKRGVDIPHVSPEFETNVPGIFIAGELGGMGLIRNAIEQGRQAMDAIKKRRDKRFDYDVVIIGAGPAGFSASLGALEAKLRFVTLEQDTFGGTVAHFPRGKIVMTQAATLPLVGKVRFKETKKESLMEFWEQARRRTKLKINTREKMEDITPHQGGFIVTTAKAKYKTKNVLLTIGRRGTPRKLDVPGEDLPKVVYRLIDPEQYRNQHVLVVGGGDAALEAATSIAEEPGTTVTLSYRSEAFGRAKPKNREKVDLMAKSGRLKLLMKSTVKEISKDKVVIDHDGKITNLPNNGIIVCAGGVLPTPFLKQIGIKVETKYGTA